MSSWQGQTARVSASEVAAKKKLEELDAELQEVKEVIDSLFSTRKPKNGWAGLSSGVKSIGKGTVVGVASLVAQPIVGAQLYGAKGFFAGLATGVVSLVAFPVTGICVGTYQMGRGVVNSVQAVKSSRKGMQWSPETREWYFYAIDQEAEELERLSRQKTCLAGSSSYETGPRTRTDERPVKDREFYDLFQISTNASQAEIKLVYYKEGRSCHPDTNPNDPGAATKFQELGHAYQILSNEQSRAIYDKNGKPEISADADIQEIDPYVFFAVMFGSHSVEPYIGELWRANTADTMDISGEEDIRKSAADMARKRAASRKEAKFKQRQRETKCAINLRERIAPFVDELKTSLAFTQSCREEAQQIVEGTVFGEMFCTTIGFALQVEADEFLGFQQSLLGVKGRTVRARKKAQSCSTNMKIVGASIKAAHARQKAYREVKSIQKQARKANDTEEGEEGSGEKMDAEQMALATQKFEESLPSILALAWAKNVHDINRTLKKVCHRLFTDTAVSMEVRERRAEAVLILGHEFFAVGKAAGGTELKLVYEKAVLTSDHRLVAKSKKQLDEAEEGMSASPPKAKAGMSASPRKAEAGMSASPHSISTESATEKPKKKKSDHTLKLDEEARSLMEQGDFDRAIQMLTQALLVRRKRLTKLQKMSTHVHPVSYNKEKNDVARTLGEIGRVLVKKGSSDQAKIVFNEAVHMYRSNGLDEEDPCVKDILVELEQISA